MIDDISLDVNQGVDLNTRISTMLVNGDRPSSLLLLQGKPIAEPVAKYGPFVMNNQEEIRQALEDYRLTRFGGWPWPYPDQVHARDKGRFAQYPDGTLDTR